MAIAMAANGGMGVIHRNLEPPEQAEQVRLVKKYESGMVMNPITIHPDETLADAFEVMKRNRISGIPVVERGPNGSRGKLVGILTNRDVRFATNSGAAGRRADDPRPPDHGPRGRHPGRGQAPSAPVPHREAAGRRRPLPLHRPDHRQGHREARRLPERRQGRAGPPAGRRRHHDGRQRLRAGRAPDRCRLRRDRGRHRPRPLDQGARRGRPGEAALERRAGHRRQRRDPGRRAGADRCRRRRHQGRHRAGLDLHHPHRGGRRRAAAHRPDGGRRGRRRGRTSRSSPTAASSIPATSPRRSRPAPRWRCSARCSPAPTRPPARCSCTRAARTSRTAAWARSARWPAARPTATSRPR